MSNNFINKLVNDFFGIAKILGPYIAISWALKLLANLRTVFLEKNLQRNQGHLRVLHAAVGDGSPLSLDVSKGVLTSTQASGGALARTEKVPGCTLESLCSQNGPFDVLVMDVEGAEQQVLRGEAWRLMRLIIVEWHPTLIGQDVFQQGQEALRSAGFRCVVSRQGSPHIVEAWERLAA